MSFPHNFFGLKEYAKIQPLFFIVAIFVNIGMWFERFVIVVTSLANEFMPANWDYFTPTIVDIFTFIGTFGFFSVLFLLFLRFLPLMAFSEIKAVTPQANPHNDNQNSI